MRIVFLPGTYELDEPIILTPEDSGTADAPLILMADEPGTVILSAGQSLHDWDTSDHQVWEAPLASGLHPYQFFVGGQRRFRSRLPVKGFFFTDRPARHQEQRSRSFLALPGDLDGIKDLDEGVEVIVFHSWNVSRHSVVNYDRTDRLLMLDQPAHWSFGTFSPRQRYYLENVAEDFLKPGQWRYEPKRHVIRYRPLPGEVAKTLQAMVPRHRNVVVFQGRPEQDAYVEHVLLRGLRMAYTKRGVSAAAMAGDEQSSVKGFDAAVVGRGVRDIVIEDCSISQTGEHAIWFRDASHDVTIRRNHLCDLGGGGVYVGDTAAVTFYSKRELPPAGDASHVNIDNNLIYDGGVIFPGAVAVMLGHASDCSISHNEIANFSYTAVSVGRTWGMMDNPTVRNRIEANHIHHIGNGLLSDGGGIYLLGISPGTVVRGNYIHDLVPYDDEHMMNGIYLDEGSSHILIEQNVVRNVANSALMLHYGGLNTVRNNLFINPGHHPIFVRQAVDRLGKAVPTPVLTFEQNVVLLGDSHDPFPEYLNGDVLFRRNLYWNPDGGDLKFLGQTWAQWRAEGNDKDSIIADPQLTIIGDDISLAGSSPARRLGFTMPPIRQAGLTGDDVWRNQAAKIKPRPMSDRTPPPSLTAVPVTTSFEDQAPGEWPMDATTWSVASDKRIVVTDEDAVDGQKSLRIDAGRPGLHMYWNPRLLGFPIEMRFALKLLPGSDAGLLVEARDWRENPYVPGPSIAIDHQGLVVANGQPAGRVIPGRWYDFIIRIESLRGDTLRYRLRILNGSSVVTDTLVGTPAPGFEELTWFGFVPSGTNGNALLIDRVSATRVNTDE